MPDNTAAAASSLMSARALPESALPETSPARRIPELDGLRCVAVMAVFLHHALAAPLLWAGVDVFFVLSGFLITGILLDRKADGGSYFGHFYARRARRILPAYYVALLLATLLFGGEWLHRWYYFTFFATNIAEAIRRDNQSLRALWSLAVEEQFYFVWPLVVLLASERTLRKLAWTVVFLSPLLRALCTPLFVKHFPIYFLTPFRSDLLCAGTLLQMAWRQDRARFRRWQTAAWTLFVTACVLLIALPWRWEAWKVYSNTRRANACVYSLTLLAAASLLVLALGGTGWFAALLRVRAVRYVGIVSYTFYLVHNMALGLVARVIHRPVLAAIPALLLALAWSSLSWHLMESRILHYKFRRRGKSGGPMLEAA